MKWLRATFGVIAALVVVAIGVILWAIVSWWGLP